ncbi:MAG: bifunctional folylpolyglutamate synthase/dihydrofolate synthase [Thermoplasmata archaeon]
MDIEEYLFSLSRFGVKLGLEPTREFASILGNPQDSFKSVHITGSNGKGSTSTFIYRILRNKLRTGLYTSPHLRNFTERIIVDDREIDWDYIRNFLSSHDTRINIRGNDVQLTFFEYTTCLAFQYFRDSNVEYASVEVGLGGRLDSTNIITPELSVITSISLEHADKLGGNIEDIAREKAGIIKSGKPVVVGRMPESPKNIIRKIAESRNSKVYDLEDYSIENVNFTLDGTSYNFRGNNGNYNVKLKALGRHQVINSAMALLAYENMNVPITPEEALKSLAEKDIPGRFEIRRRDPLLILDGAHNSEAMRNLAENIRLYRIKNPLVVLGLLRDKNSYNILQNLSEITDQVVVTEPNEKERKKYSEELKNEASLFFKDITVLPNPEDAVDYAIKSNQASVITGSLYLVGEAENILDRKLN